jgi:hypothetical protein
MAIVSAQWLTLAKQSAADWQSISLKMATGYERKCYTSGYIIISQAWPFYESQPGQ